jgi:hypothetical protein
VKGDLTIIKGVNLFGRTVHVVKQGDISAHGDTKKDAIAALKLKIDKNRPIEETIEECKKTKKVTIKQYRIITGACEYGVKK